MSAPHDEQPHNPQARREDLPPEFQTDLTLPPDYFEPNRKRGARPPSAAPVLTPDGHEDAYADDGDYDTTQGGPGCLLWTAVMLMGMLIAVAVVVAAGTAGYTEGKHIADANLASTQNALAERQLPAIQTNVADLNAVQLGTRVAILLTRTPGVPIAAELQVTATQVSLNVTATQQGLIDEQLTLIPEAVLRGDSAQVEQRLAFLATQTPGVMQVAEFAITATALAQNPMVEDVTTPMPSEAVAPSEAIAPSEAVAPQVTPTSTSLDPNALLAQAQEQISFNQLEEATRTLDLIIRLDPTFQSELVNRLMFDTLSQRAATAFRVNLVVPSQTGTLAEAVRLTDQAELYGTATQLGELVYERQVAEAYLNAIAAIEAGDHLTASRRLETILQMQSNYKGIDITGLLFDEYVAYGDALYQYDRNGCLASNFYAQALALFNNSEVAGKKSSADTLCQQGSQPAVQPTGNYLPGETPVAPIGQPGT